LSERVLGGRGLKKWVLDLLLADDLAESLKDLAGLPPRQVVNPLISFLCHENEEVRWRSVIAIGYVTRELADQDMEGARIVMRRLLWSLNDESGGIGWGAPEAMAEIMVSHDGLAREYGPMFMSYFDPRGNFLEHELLQRGLLWGLVRLARVKPQVVAGVAPHLSYFLESSDSVVKGLAAWAAGLISAGEPRPRLSELLNDRSLVRIYVDGRLLPCTVRDLAEKGLSALDGRIEDTLTGENA
jgi:hypothetical protein